MRKKCLRADMNLTGEGRLKVIERNMEQVFWFLRVLKRNLVEFISINERVASLT